MCRQGVLINGRPCSTTRKTTHTLQCFHLPKYEQREATRHKKPSQSAIPRIILLQSLCLRTIVRDKTNAVAEAVDTLIWVSLSVTAANASTTPSRNAVPSAVLLVLPSKAPAVAAAMPLSTMLRRSLTSVVLVFTAPASSVAFEFISVAALKIPRVVFCSMAIF